MSQSSRYATIWLSGIICLLLSFLLGLCLGSTAISLTELRDAVLWLFQPQSNPGTQELVLWEIRFPRVLMAANAGAVLALGGLVFQTILRNPLADPYILGISGGASVGVICAVLLGLGTAGNGLFAFAGGLLTLFAVCLLGKQQNSLLLSGVMINSFCGAVILFLVSLVKSHEISSIIYWTMGNLGACDLNQSLLLTLFFLPGCLLLLLFGHSMNLLLLGSDAAQTLGINARKISIFLLALTSLLISATVAAVGPLGFVGLVVPQTLRLVLGHDHRILAPACLLYGAAFLVLCDTIARTLPAQGELPAGVITALIGAPLFIALLRKST